jgi:hypothetical protein
MIPTLRSACASGRFVVLMLVCVLPVRAQESSTQIARNAIYFEGFGQGMLYSINYDYRIDGSMSIRAGFTRWSIPFIFIRELTATGVPLTVNYLSGERNSHFEAGIGVVLFHFRARGSWFVFSSDTESSANLLLGTATVGYRYQPRDGGFLFRIGVTPFFTLDDGAFYARLHGGISFGFVF